MEVQLTMNQKLSTEITKSIQDFRFPKYHEIPDVGLFLEQVAKYISSFLEPLGDMTVTGSIQAGLTGDNSVLIAKATLDLVSSMLLASSLGVGVLLSAGAVLLIQGGLVLLAGVVSPLMTAGAINEMTCAGSLLIVMIGTNLMGITKIKVADYLPAILLAPVIYHIAAII